MIQGLGGGGLAPSEQAILADTFPAQKRGMAFAIYGMAVVLAPAIGPTLGGYITDNFDWRWIFFINVPVAIVSLILDFAAGGRSAASSQRCEKRPAKWTYIGLRPDRGRSGRRASGARQGPARRLVLVELHFDVSDHVDGVASLRR